MQRRPAWQKNTVVRLLAFSLFDESNFDEKKIRQRKKLQAWLVVSLVLFLIGVHFLWAAMTHRGPGVWTFGGDEPGTDSSAGTEEFQEVIPQDEYRRYCYVSAAMFFLFGGVALSATIAGWKKRNELEEAWRRKISHPEGLQDIHKKPELYRDDFKQWLNENHPH